MEGDGENNNQVTLEDVFKLFKQMKKMYDTLDKLGKEMPALQQQPASTPLGFNVPPPTTTTAIETEQELPSAFANLSTESATDENLEQEEEKKEKEKEEEEASETRTNQEEI